ncbi:hypothetical protein Tco_0270987 [Tanacetum coccineum]
MSSNSDDIQVVGSDTRPPMLDRTDYESWVQQRIWLNVSRKMIRNIVLAREMVQQVLEVHKIELGMLMQVRESLSSDITVMGYGILHGTALRPKATIRNLEYFKDKNVCSECKPKRMEQWRMKKRLLFLDENNQHF